MLKVVGSNPDRYVVLLPFSLRACTFQVNTLMARLDVVNEIFLKAMHEFQKMRRKARKEFKARVRKFQRTQLVMNRQLPRDVAKQAKREEDLVDKVANLDKFKMKLQNTTATEMRTAAEKFKRTLSETLRRQAKSARRDWEDLAAKQKRDYDKTVRKVRQMGPVIKKSIDRLPFNDDVEEFDYDYLQFNDSIGVSNQKLNSKRGFNHQKYENFHTAVDAVKNTFNATLGTMREFFADHPDNSQEAYEESYSFLPPTSRKHHEA